MNVISAFEHNIRAILLFGSGPEYVAQELGELHYHIDFMCMLMLLFHYFMYFDSSSLQVNHHMSLVK